MAKAASEHPTRCWRGQHSQNVRRHGENLWTNPSRETALLKTFVGKDHHRSQQTDEVMDRTLSRTVVMGKHDLWHSNWQYLDSVWWCGSGTTGYEWPSQGQCELRAKCQHCLQLGWCVPENIYFLVCHLVFLCPLALTFKLSICFGIPLTKACVIHVIYEDSVYELCSGHQSHLLGM